jgi:hypothetical protein
MSRNILATLSIACLLTMPVNRLHADYLQAFSGNSHAASTAGAEIIENYAVLSRSGGTAGDVYGTGFAGFDALAGIKENAQYLYLYQFTPLTGGFAGGAFGDSQPRFGSITSVGTANLSLTDNNGAVSPTNSFGTDTAPFVGAAGASLGVISPSVGLAAGTLVPSTPSYTATTFTFTTGAIPADQTSVLYAFTSNVAPVIIPAPPAGPSFASGAFVAPAAVPEPSSIVLAILGIAGLFALRQRKA